MVLRYTGNANRVLVYFIIPCMAVFYIGFLFWSDHNYEKLSNPKELQATADRKAQVTESIDSVDGIILGGSNASLGLSASLMSKLSNLRWANLALSNDGFSHDSYFQFLSNILTDQQRKGVSYIVYSSAEPRKKRLLAFESRGLTGKKPFSYIPQFSMASYVRDFFSGTGPNMEEQRFDGYGDLDFDSIDCTREITYHNDYTQTLSKSELVLWSDSLLTNVSELFPNAKIILSLPNAFDQTAENDRATNYLKVILERRAINFATKTRRSIYSRVEVAYPLANLMCNDSWHANRRGREWRTNGLFNYIQSLN